MKTKRLLTKALIAIVLSVFSVGLTYSAFAVGLWESNIGLWDSMARGMFAWISVVMILFSVGITTTFEIDEL